MSSDHVPLSWGGWLWSELGGDGWRGARPTGGGRDAAKHELVFVLLCLMALFLSHKCFLAFQTRAGVFATLRTEPDVTLELAPLRAAAAAGVEGPRRPRRAD